MTSAVFGRRIHIAGSLPEEGIVGTAEAKRAREFVEQLVKELVKKGATFVLPVDAEKKRTDGIPFCFEWLIWTTIARNLLLRPHGAPTPVAVAVKHHKSDEQIPEEHIDFWDEFSATDNVRVDHAAHWNMNSKRMELQARHGDVLITVGGGEGVLFLANAYHDAGKPVIPVDFPVSTRGSGTNRICTFAEAGNAQKLFRTDDPTTAQTWLSRITPSSRAEPKMIVGRVMDLLEVLERPTAFAVRLLNPERPDYVAVEEFFEIVVKPVIEDEYGYRLTVVDGKQAVEESRIDQDIFSKLRRSGLVIADLTGERPNCFLELGYALGRSARAVVTFQEGTKTPFDVTTYAAHVWKRTADVLERRARLREHLESIESRAPIVNDTPLIP
jgi:hypothetical protein